MVVMKIQKNIKHYGMSIMPNYQESTSEKLMIDLTNKLNDSQNELFSLILEESCMCGMDIESLIVKYEDFQDLSTMDRMKTFSVLIKVLHEHEQETIRNFEN